MLRTENAPASEHKTIYLKDYKPFPYTVEKVDLVIRVFEGRTHVTSNVTYKLKDEPADLILNGESQKILSVAINGSGVSPEGYSISRDGKFTMPCPGKEAFTLTFDTEIVPETNTSLSGLYKSGDMYCTQCESEGFRRITYYPDRPDVMSIFTCRLEADKAALPILLCNGNLTQTGEMEGGRHFAVWHDPFKKPAYLFAVVFGNLAHIEDHFTTMSGRDVTLRIYTRAADIDQAEFGMQALIQSFKWDEEAYGREYDLDIFNIVAVGDFNFGAMENKSLNIFNTSRLLARPDLTTDKEFLDIRRVIGHEYFHNWSGNRVTCRDWFQLSLKEGFTVFRENGFGQAVFDPEVERIEEVNLVRTMQFPEDAGPLAHPIRPDNYIEITNFYTMTVYEKGGEVIRMLYTLLGPKKFREATDLYFSRHDGQAATCDDFVKCMSDISGRDLSQFMNWYHQAGTPTVKAEGTYDAAKKQYTLTLSQTVPATPGQPTKQPAHIPVAVGLIGANGQDMDLGGETTKILELTQASQTFTFDNIGSAPIPSLFRGFSAPVKLAMERSEEDLRFLMVHDSDGVNQWDAGQTLMLRAFDRGLKAIATPGTPMPNEASLVEALRGMVANLRNSKRALLAHMLTLPDESIIAAAHQPTNPTAIHAVRDCLESAIAYGLKDEWTGLYQDNAPLSPDFSLEPDAVARRALRNISLYYLTKAMPAEGMGLAKSQYQHATNMSDRLGAMKAVMDSNDPLREEFLKDFYDRFQQHPLVVDKWFMVQASAVRPTIVHDVKALMDHPAFGMKNPNRVRALLGAFAMRNMSGFHHPSGEGYKLLADAVIQLNTINPQVGARLLTPMRQWKTFTPDLADKMKVELERILHSGDLSPDIFEVVSKTLNG